MAEIAAGYGQVFSVPFGYCDEGPLVIEGLPAECTFSHGWRNYLSGDAESFLLEPLDVVLFTIDELIANGLPIDAADAQVLRAHEFRMGYLAGVVQTALGEAGLYGPLVALANEAGVWSSWAPIGGLSVDEVAGRRAMLDGCRGGGRSGAWEFADPLYRECSNEYRQCLVNAERNFENAKREASNTFNNCISGVPALFTTAAVAACLASIGTGPGALIACLSVGLGVFVVSTLFRECFDAYDRSYNTALRLWKEEAAVCMGRLRACIDSKRKAGGPGQAPELAPPSQPHGGELPTVPAGARP